MDQGSNVWRLIEGFDVSKVDKIARRILSKVGLLVPREDLRKELSRCTKVEGKRVLIPEGVFEEFVKEIRGRFEGRRPEERERLFIFASRWPCFFVAPQTLEIRPFDKEHLVTFTKLLDSFHGTDVGGSVPGWVQDEPPPLRPIVTYFIECCFSRSASFPGIGWGEEILEWMGRMAEVMGHEFSIGVETFSPLRFSGNSLDLALKFKGRIRGVGLDPMPIMGVSAPLDWNAAWGQSVAENMGGYILLRLLGFDKVWPSFRLFPGSMASGAIAFGAPEYILCLLTRTKVREFYGLPPGGAEAMLTTATLPGHQATAEKMCLTMLSALAGFKVIEGAGTLGIDEIFSPQQLMIDIEIKGYVERVLFGLKDEERSDPFELVMEGLQEGHFLVAPYTVERWRKFYWRPYFFRQLTRAQRQTESKDFVLNEAWERAKGRIERHDFELDPERKRELERIVREAREALSG